MVTATGANTSPDKKTPHYSRTMPYSRWTQTKCATKLRYSPIHRKKEMVRKERLELSRREALEPKSSVSTNSTTSAKWGGRWDLNPRQPESQSGALPTELRPPFANCKLSSLRFGWHVRMARPAGFEPATHGLEGRCSIQLSYGRIVESAFNRKSGR